MKKSLIATLGIGRKTWGHVKRLIAEQDWDKIIIISNEWGKQHFAPDKECEWIMVNDRSGFDSIKSEIKNKLPEGKIAISLISGSGKEHMALIAALKEEGRDIELVTITKEGIKYY
ncbi:MAG: hypothetical protein N3D73_01335 [Candidatus Diapherotrites archaeon]|nr:hypothetical protein [Candidatus Diapherotrites archaeon]